MLAIGHQFHYLLGPRVSAQEMLLDQSQVARQTHALGIYQYLEPHQSTEVPHLEHRSID